MIEEKECLGADVDGITQVSLDALKQFKDKHLAKVLIFCNGRPTDIRTDFIFEDCSYYLATGFSIGYGGEGPRGLWEAMKMFCPDKIDSDFWNTKIPQITSNTDWKWTPEKGWKIFK